MATYTHAEVRKMQFLIEYDTRQVVCKSDEECELQNFVDQNDLDMVFLVVGSVSDLDIFLSEREIEDLFNWLLPNTKQEISTDLIWDTIVEREGDFKRFTKTLGKRISKGEEPVTAKSKTIESKPKTIVKTKSSDLDSNIFELGNVEVKPTTAKGLLRVCIEDNLGEATMIDLLEKLSDELSYDENKSKGYIRSAINKDIIRIKL